jgi:alanyl-tRNA synthetase
MNIREEFLTFFQSKGHTLYQSMPLIPDDDTLLFVNAGMVQFKDIFTRKLTSSTQRAVSSQMCLRAGGKHNDLENVGYTRRHHTFFEMLGNFSFGDDGSYFKKDAIAYAYEFVIDILKLPEDKIYATVHNDDNEAFDIWCEYLPKDKIKRLGDRDNFWQMGDIGPCGPCSEIFYDQGDKFDSDEDYLGGDGDRFLEIWNLVFMQYEKKEDGSLEKLEKPCIDTGMGLERVIAIKEGVDSNFDSSVFMPLINEIETLVNKEYKYESGASYRVIADHIRSSVFLISDGVLFDKEGRGYVLRRILRRAIRHGYLLGLKKPFLYKLVDTVIDAFIDVYSILDSKREYIKEQIQREEDRFFMTIAKGMELFNEELKNTDKIFSGDVAFKLYDTYGFPLDLTEDMLKDKNLKVDLLVYEQCMQEQRQKARANWKGSGDIKVEGDFKSLIDEYGLNTFVGYDRENIQTYIETLLDEEFNKITTLSQNQKGWVLLKQTPFYAQSGGQVGDIGEITLNNTLVKVLDTKKFFELNLSYIQVIDGDINTKDTVETKVLNRDGVTRHHSATHLLQAVLKEVLGDNVSQAGSYNDDSKLRFDFTYPDAISKEQLDTIEIKVNEIILKAIAQKTEVLPIKEAQKTGAVAMFGEKYSDEVRVVSFDDISVEFCGGTHVNNTAVIGSLYIIKESSVSSGVRRIEAVCGQRAFEYAKEKIDTLAKASFVLKNTDILSAIDVLKSQILSLKQEIKSKPVSTNLQTQNIKDILVCVDISDGDIKSIIDEYKKDNDKLAIMLFKINKDKVQVACGTKGVSINAREWLNFVSDCIDGKGGGREDFATGGGKNVDNIQAAIVLGKEFVTNSI